MDILLDLVLDGVQVDAVICDPPYHLESIVRRYGKAQSAPSKYGTDGAYFRASRGFLGQSWDGAGPDGERIAQNPELWARVLTVMKPGAYLVAFSSTRTYHRMVCAIEDAGFVIHPMIAWNFAQGMPKAHRFHVEGLDTDHLRYGTQSLKPAIEPICVAQKPMTGTGSANLAAYGVGGIDIEAMRVTHADASDFAACKAKNPGRTDKVTSAVYGADRPQQSVNVLGRWSSNSFHDGTDVVTAQFPASKGQLAPRSDSLTPRTSQRVYGKMKRGGDTPAEPRGDTGSAARFFNCCPYGPEDQGPLFYASKASKTDRDGSVHATVKPQSLLRLLVRGFCPPSGVILDPFAGSGSLIPAVASAAEGRSTILIERETVYYEDCLRRQAKVATTTPPGGK